MNVQRSSLIDLLDHEMRAGKAFVRIHAAEALIEHGYGFKVARVMQSEENTTTPAYRVGVWRVLARIAPNERVRAQFIHRLRQVMLDRTLSDRLHAAESLAKLGVDDRADRHALEQWITNADDAIAAFPVWLLVLSSSPSERAHDEARLRHFLDSQDPIARLRAGFALGRLRELSAASRAALRRRARAEPSHSPARVYLAAGALLHTRSGSSSSALFKTVLRRYLRDGKPNEQLEAGTVLGQRGTAADIPFLEPLLKNHAADARIGAANGLLHFVS
jgi:SSS family solute:Na+ symporter